MWSIGRNALGVSLILMFAACAGQTISLVNSTVTTKANADLDTPKPQSTFRLTDIIRVTVFVTWPDVTASGGLHHVEWNWYRGAQLVSQGKHLMRFNTAPADLWTIRAASSLGVGSYKVETIIDGNVISTDSFTIAA